MPARPSVQRFLSAAVAAGVALSGTALATAVPADAAEKIVFQRVAGADRFQTAVEASRLAFPDGGAGGVVLVNGWRPTDGLTASGLAGVSNAAILYAEKDRVSPLVLREIERLDSPKITIVGGTAALSENVKLQLKKAGLEVDRLAGADRFATSVVVAEKTIKSIEVAGGTPRVAFAASGADADVTKMLALAPLAYEQAAPIVLGRPTGNPYVSYSITGGKILTVVDQAAAAKNVLELMPSLGDSAKVLLRSDQDLGRQAGEVARFRAELTSSKVANIALLSSLRPSAADALSSAPFLGKAGASVLFAGLPSTQTFLEQHATDLTGSKWVIGGTASVPESAVAAAAAAATPPVVTTPPASAPDTTPPTITSVAVDGPRQITVRTSRPVAAQGGTLAAAQFAYNATGSVQGQVLNPTTGGAVIGQDGTSVVLTFASDLATTADATFIYTDSDPNADGGDVVAANGAALAPRVVTGVLDQQRPWITGARVVNARTVEVTFSEPVVGQGGTRASIAPGSFRYDDDTLSGGPGTAATSIYADPDEMAKVRLLWGADTALTATTAADAIAYTATTTVGDVVDRVGNQLATGEQRSTDDARFPYITRAQLINDVGGDHRWLSPNDTLQLTFSERVSNGAVGSPSEQQVRDLLGVSGITYNGGFVLFGSSPSTPTVLTLTVRAQPLSSGLIFAGQIPGGVTTAVVNTDGNPTAAAPVPGVLLE